MMSKRDRDFIRSKMDDGGKKFIDNCDRCIVLALISCPIGLGFVLLGAFVWKCFVLGVIPVILWVLFNAFNVSVEAWRREFKDTKGRTR